MEEEKFIRSVAEQLGVDHERAWAIISAVFRELHDRLTPKRRPTPVRRCRSG